MGILNEENFKNYESRIGEVKEIKIQGHYADNKDHPLYHLYQQWKAINKYCKKSYENWERLERCSAGTRGKRWYDPPQQPFTGGILFQILKIGV